MKSLTKPIAITALNVMLCFAFTAIAQQRGADNSNRPPANNGGGSAPAQHNIGVTQQPQRSNTNVAPQQHINNAPQGRGNNVGPQQRGNNVAPQRQNHVQRGGNYNQTRIGVVPNGTYRSYPGLAYGRNHITVRPRGTVGIYYNSHGTYRSFYRPKLGVSVTVLPNGYYPFYFGPRQYFYSDGFFYQYADNEYTVVDPPIGASLATLPDKAQSIVINGVQYYELDGVYYQPVTKDDGTVAYQVAGKDGALNTEDPNAQQQALPQVGDLVNNLPDGCKTLKLGGQKYYVSSDGYYFQDAVAENGDKVYKIVGTPTDEPTN